MSHRSKRLSDPRALQTRLVLQRALMELVCKQDFDTVTVAKIATEAGKNRATFYKHYRDKYELMSDCMLGWLDTYCRQLEVTPPSDLEAALPVLVTDIVEHYMEHRRFYLAVLDHARLPAFHSLFTRTLQRHFAQLIARMGERGGFGGVEATEKLAVFISYACFGALLDWLDHGEPRSTKQHCEAISQLMLKLLRA